MSETAGNEFTDAQSREPATVVPTVETRNTVTAQFEPEDTVVTTDTQNRESESKEESETKRDREEVEQLGKRLATHLQELAGKGMAKELGERVSAYCKVERITQESLECVIDEMGKVNRLNSLGRALAAVPGRNSTQRWRDFMRTWVERGSGSTLLSRAQPVIPGMAKSQLALAMEWMMGGEVGAVIIRRAEEAMRDVKTPCRTLYDVITRATAPGELRDRMASNLLNWSRERMPIPSFLEYVQTHSKIADSEKKTREEEARKTAEGERAERETARLLGHRNREAGGYTIVRAHSRKCRQLMRRPGWPGVLGDVHVNV